MTDSHTMASIKTTISLPADLFKRIERYRKRAKVSRSQAFATAAERLLSGEEEDRIRAKINEVFSDPRVRSDQKAFAAIGAKSFAGILKDKDLEW